MGLFRRNRADEYQLAGLKTDVVKLRELTDDLTKRLTRLETRPLPRPNPVTAEALARVEELANQAARNAAIARADVAVRVSNLDAVIADLSSRLNSDHAALRTKIADLSTTLDCQAEYLEAHADQVAVTLAAYGTGEPGSSTPADLRANQTRIANDLARLTIELRDEVAKLASVVKPGERAHAYAMSTSTATSTNGTSTNGTPNGADANDTEANAEDDVIDLR
jgi:hypothetical protein